MSNFRMHCRLLGSESLTYNRPFNPIYGQNNKGKQSLEISTLFTRVKIADSTQGGKGNKVQIGIDVMF